MLFTMDSLTGRGGEDKHKHNSGASQLKASPTSTTSPRDTHTTHPILLSDTP